jgi:hypothetical protein
MPVASAAEIVTGPLPWPKPAPPLLGQHSGNQIRAAAMRSPYRRSRAKQQRCPGAWPDRLRHATLTFIQSGNQEKSPANSMVR